MNVYSPQFRIPAAPKQPMKGSKTPPSPNKKVVIVNTNSSQEEITSKESSFGSWDKDMSADTVRKSKVFTINNDERPEGKATPNF